MERATLAPLERSFGHDFADVRVHNDGRAAESARAVDALAYTVGKHIVFGAGQYRPSSTPGRRLLAHELTHTLQQGTASSGSRNPEAIVEPSSPLEREAEGVAAAIVDGRPIGGLRTSPGNRIARTVPPPPPPDVPKTYKFSITTKGCDKAPYDDATIRTAARQAFDKVMNTSCVLSKSLKDAILAEFNGLEIACQQNADSNAPCGYARSYFSSTVNLNPAVFAAQCGPVASTILHEVVHLTEWSLAHGETADACEKSCFNTGSGDATKCK